jgi:hypothetical protein
MYSVIAAASSKNLTTREAVKTELGITGAGEDAKIDRLIARLSATICDEIGVPMAADGSKTVGLQTVEEKFFNSPWFRRKSGKVRLALKWVTEIVSVKVGAVDIDLADVEIVDGPAGIIRRTGAVALPAFSYAPETRTIIQFKAGFTMPPALGYTLPLPLEGAAIDMIRSARFAADRDPKIKSEWTTDIERLEYWVGQIGESGAFPPEVASVLDPYRYEPEVG